MPINDFLPFCPTDTGTNLMTQSDYATSTGRTQGNQPGIASSKLVNKALRQASYMVSGLAQFIANTLNQDVKDDATPSELVGQISMALTIPSGVVIPFAGSAAPAGFLLTDGSAISRTQYANLYAIIGDTYGAGDGTTTFNLPNTQGLFIRSAGSQTLNGKAFSATLGAASNDTTAVNGMYIADPTHNHVVYTIGNAGAGGYAGLNYTYNFSSSAPAGYSNGQGVPFVQASYTGVYPASNDYETKPASLAMNYIIKT